MSNRNVLITSLLAFPLAVATATPALADGGRHGHGPIGHITNAIVGTTVFALTLPLAIAAAVTGAPLYGEQGPGYEAGYEPGYDRGYERGSRGYGYGYAEPRGRGGYYAPRPSARYYAPYGAAPYYPHRHGYDAPPRSAYYGRPSNNYAPSYGDRRYRH